MSRRPPVLFIALTILLSGCIKKSATLSSNDLIDQAHSYFDQSVAAPTKSPNRNSYRASQAKTPLWDQAHIQQTSTGTAVVVPIAYKNNLYISLHSDPVRSFKLSDLTTLVIFRDAKQIQHAALITFIPDSGTIQYGTYLVEDWQGNSIEKPVCQSPQCTVNAANNIQVADRAQPTGGKQSDAYIIIEQCSEIDGYNYSEGDEDGGEYWSETTCSTYPVDGGGTGGDDGSSAPADGDLPGLTSPSSGASYQIAIAPPGSPVSNIADYMKCITMGLPIDHTYSVTVCVDQPVPGTRQAWGYTQGGSSGSSSAGNPVNTGHVFLVLTENSQGTIITRNVGFYPSGFVFPISGMQSSQGALNNDQAHEYNISLTLSVSGGQMQQIINYVSLGNNAGFYYDLNTNNCTTFVLNALQAGDISLPATVGTWPGGSGYDPGDLGEDIRTMPLTSKETRNTVSNDHPNVGTCN